MWVAKNNSKESKPSLYYFKPNRLEEHDGTWYGRGGDYGYPLYEVPSFDNLTWENEPVEVSIVPFMLNAVQAKLAESVDEYFDYISHAQDIHPYSKEKEQELYDNMCWRWQDWNAVKYDDPSTWELNFNDYVGSEK